MTEGAPHEYKERPSACPDCGNSPVNHFEHYISSALAIWSADALERGKGARAFITRHASVLFDASEQILLRALSVMPFASFSSRVGGAATYRSQVIWEEAERRGVRMEQLLIFGRGTEVYRARLEKGWFFFHSLPIPPHKRGESSGWMDDKFVLKRVLAGAGIPTPSIRSVSSLPRAVRAMRDIGRPVVVKPRSGSRGRHTTVNVRTEAQLEEAFRVARALCPFVAIEEFLPGSVCRGSVVGGALVGFFRADPPTVVADGVSSIEDLIAQANTARSERVQPIVLTAEHVRFLARAGYTPRSVPPGHARVPLTHRTGRLFGGATREMLGLEHPKLRSYLERAARSLGVGVVGFDLIIQDPERDPDEQIWGIIEANSLPYIDLHYLALEGAPSNVAAAVWDLWPETMHSAPLDAGAARATMEK